MPSLPLRRSTSGRVAPSSPSLRHSTSASTTVVADVHRDATERTTSGLSPRPRDQRGPEVVAPRQLAGQQRQRLAAAEDRRCRVLRHPVSEFSAAAERDQRQWTSLEHSATDARRSSSIERPTRRVHSYEDRHTLRRHTPEVAFVPPTFGHVHVITAVDTTWTETRLSNKNRKWFSFRRLAVMST